MKNDYSRTTAVKAIFKRSFLSGVGSIMSLQGQTPQIPLTPANQDSDKLCADWNRVGQYLRQAIHDIHKSHSDTDK